MSNLKARMSPTSNDTFTDRQLAVICSEKQARVISLPSQTCASKVKITDTSIVVKAEVIPMKGKKSSSHVDYLSQYSGNYSSKYLASL